MDEKEVYNPIDGETSERSYDYLFLDDYRNPAFSDAAHFPDLFLSRLKAKRIEKGLREQSNVSPGVENSKNRYPAAIDMGFKLDNRAVNLAKERASIVLVRESHGNHKSKISVSFFGTNASISSSFLGTFMTMTSSSFMPFRLSTELTSGRESPEATMPLSVTATHLPLYFSTSSLTFAVSKPQSHADQKTTDAIIGEVISCR